MQATNMMYEPIYCSARTKILELSGLTSTVLDDAALELQIDYELFLSDYEGPVPLDPSVGFSQMLRAWGFPWQFEDLPSALEGLTLPQFFLSWAWRENDVAKFYVDGEAVTSGWKQADALEWGLYAAIGAAKSLAHGELLLATHQPGPDKDPLKELPALSCIRTKPKAVRKYMGVPESIWRRGDANFCRGIRYLWFKSNLWNPSRVPTATEDHKTKAAGGNHAASEGELKCQ